MVYKKPNETFQMKLSNDEINEKLKDYIKIDNVEPSLIDYHIRYFIIDSNNEKHFRIGGYLINIDDKNRYIVLSNGKNKWSVQLNNSILYRKKTENEIQNEIQNKIKISIEKNNNEEKVYLKKKYKNLYDKYKLLNKNHQIMEVKFSKLKNKFIEIYDKNKELQNISKNES